MRDSESLRTSLKNHYPQAREGTELVEVLSDFTEWCRIQRISCCEVGLRLVRTMVEGYDGDCAKAPKLWIVRDASTSTWRNASEEIRAKMFREPRESEIAQADRFAKILYEVFGEAGQLEAGHLVWGVWRLGGSDDAWSRVVDSLDELSYMRSETQISQDAKGE